MDGGIADDRHVTNNGDMPKVLATVVQIIRRFTAARPDCRIIVSGSDEARKRLYARIVSSQYEAMQDEFEVWCAHGYDEPYVPYTPTAGDDVPHAFLLVRK